jgi:hypothetical protein
MARGGDMTANLRCAEQTVGMLYEAYADRHYSQVIRSAVSIESIDPMHFKPSSDHQSILLMIFKDGTRLVND